MPDVPEVICDLLARMLNVDPVGRILVGDILRHPACLCGLPSGYCPPTPMPLPQVYGPLAVGEEIEDVLEQIGIGGRAELRSLLAQTGTNAAKAFALMLANGTDPKHLPWPVEHPFVVPVDPFIASEEITIDEQGEAIPNLWIELPVLMNMLQNHLSSTDFVWYHPSFRTIIGKARTRNVFVRLKAEWSENRAVCLRAWMERGTGDEFEDFIGGLRRLLVDVTWARPTGQLTELNSLRRFDITDGSGALLVGDRHRSGCNPM
jgi:hypothetical protein